MKGEDKNPWPNRTNKALNPRISLRSGSFSAQNIQLPESWRQRTHQKVLHSK